VEREELASAKLWGTAMSILYAKMDPVNLGILYFNHKDLALVSVCAFLSFSLLYPLFFVVVAFVYPCVTTHVDSTLTDFYIGFILCFECCSFPFFPNTSSSFRG
jgi:uncharacterized membrane protein YagU involved in acid resistance